MYRAGLIEFTPSLFQSDTVRPTAGNDTQPASTWHNDLSVDSDGLDKENVLPSSAQITENCEVWTECPSYMW